VTLAASLLVTAFAVVMTAIAVVTLWWQLHAWRTPDVLSSTGFSGSPITPQHSFSLLVPARHEQAVLGETLRRLAAVDHPDVEVVAIIGHDDPETHAVAEQVAREQPGSASWWITAGLRISPAR